MTAGQSRTAGGRVWRSLSQQRHRLHWWRGGSKAAGGKRAHAAPTQQGAKKGASRTNWSTPENAAKLQESVK